MRNATMTKEEYRQAEQVAQMLAELDAPVEQPPLPAPQEDWEFGVDDEVFIGSLIEVKPDPKFYMF